MKTEQLYEWAEANAITVEGFPLPQNKAITVQLDERYYVAVDPAVLCSNREERVCLAHELGHCETAALYNPYSRLADRQKQEKKAEAWAIGQLVPLKELKAALKNGLTDLSALCEHFEVTPAFMYEALLYYGQNNG